MSMDSGNLTLIQYYYLIHYANSNFANCLCIEFYSYFLPPIQDSTCYTSYFLSFFLSLRILYFSYPYHFILYIVPKCVFVWCFFMMMIFFLQKYFKVYIVFSGHHVRRHMISIYNITNSVNFGHLIKLSLPVTIFFPS